jgi:hypothetical protein
MSLKENKMTKKASTPRKKSGPKPGSKPTPPVAPNPFEFEAPTVDDALYGEQRAAFPAAIWMSKYAGDNEQSRPWVIDMENISRMPSPYWREEKVRFGDNPNDPFTPVYMTELMRCVPLGVRKRQIVTADDGRDHYYYIYTSRNDRVPGKLSFHYQVMVSLSGLPYDELVVLGLRGLTRTLSWQHDGKRYSDFPVGVEDQLQDYADEASKVVGGEMPIWCAWWTDLRGVYRDNAPYYISVGPNDETWVQPFGVDLRTSQEPRNGSPYNDDHSLKIDDQGLPYTRYVGGEMFQKYQEIYRDIVGPWIAEWSQEGMANATPITANGGNNEYNQGGNNPIGDEEDEIPF